MEIPGLWHHKGHNNLIKAASSTISQILVTLINFSLIGLHDILPKGLKLTSISVIYKRISNL